MKFYPAKKSVKLTYTEIDEANLQLVWAKRDNWSAFVVGSHSEETIEFANTVARSYNELRCKAWGVDEAMRLSFDMLPDHAIITWKWEDENGLYGRNMQLKY